MRPLHPDDAAPELLFAIEIHGEAAGIDEEGGVEPGIDPVLLPRHHLLEKELRLSPTCPPKGF